MKDLYRRFGIIIGLFFFVHHYLIMRVIPSALKRFLKLADGFLAKRENGNGRNRA